MFRVATVDRPRELAMSAAKVLPGVVAGCAVVIMKLTVEPYARDDEINIYRLA
jgi:hypothetical protein